MKVSHAVLARALKRRIGGAWDQSRVWRTFFQDVPTSFTVLEAIAAELGTSIVDVLIRAQDPPIVACAGVARLCDPPRRYFTLSGELGVDGMDAIVNAGLRAADDIVTIDADAFVSLTHDERWIVETFRQADAAAKTRQLLENVIDAAVRQIGRPRRVPLLLDWDPADTPSGRAARTVADGDPAVGLGKIPVRSR